MLIDFDYIRYRANKTADRWIVDALQSPSPAVELAAKLTDSGFKIRDMLGHRFYGRSLLGRSQEDQTLFGEILVLSLAAQKTGIYAHNQNLRIIPEIWQTLIEWDKSYREDTETLYKAFNEVRRDFGAYAPTRFENLGIEETTRYMAHLAGNMDKFLYDFLQEPWEQDDGYRVMLSALKPVYAHHARAAWTEYKFPYPEAPAATL